MEAPWVRDPGMTHARRHCQPPVVVHLPGWCTEEQRSQRLMGPKFISSPSRALGQDQALVMREENQSWLLHELPKLLGSEVSRWYFFGVDLSPFPFL